MKRYLIFFGVFFGLFGLLLMFDKPPEKEEDPTPSIYATWDNKVAYTHKVTSSTSKTKVPISEQIVATINNTYAESQYYIVEGSVKNASDSVVKFIKVKASFLSSNGEVLDTKDTYAVGDSGLKPNESSTFKIYLNNDDEEIEKVFCEVYDYVIE